jgi:hypothetical protein
LRIWNELILYRRYSGKLKIYKLPGSDEIPAELIEA